MSKLVKNNVKARILHYMPDGEVLELLANYFQAYSDKTRIKILSALSISELCVNDISSMLGLNQTTVSHQLKLLKSLSLVKYKREGRLIYYSLSSTKINEIMMCGVEHLEKSKYIYN